MGESCPADARSLSCTNGLACKEFAPDARLWNLNYVQTAYQWRTPQWTPFDSQLRIDWASTRTSNNIARIVQRVASRIKAFVWGIKTSSLTDAPGADLEFYFYGYQWDVVREAIDHAVGCTVRNLSVPFVPMMISVNVPPAGESVHEVDVYEGPTSSAYVQYNDSTHEYKNHYWLDFVKTRGANGSAAVAEQLDWVGLGRRHLVYDEWEFGLAVARKTRSRKGIYFSGVPVDRTRQLVPAVLRTALRAAPGSALVDVAFDVVGDEIVNTCVYNGFIVESSPVKRVVTDGVDVMLFPGFANRQEVARLRADHSPDRSHPRDYPLSFGAVGEYRAALWNTIPADECYHHHGVLVRDHTGLEGRPRLQEFDWVRRRAQLLTQLPLRLLEVRTKSHVAQSNGVWLHTDAQREHLDWLRVDTEPGLTRDFLVLLHLTTLADEDGGKLHVFHNSSVTLGAQRIDQYQSNTPISFHDPISTSKVGGEWRHGLNTFWSVLELSPRAGQAVLMDHRAKDNVHAVTQMHTATQRELLEAWFSVVPSAKL